MHNTYVRTFTVFKKRTNPAERKAASKYTCKGMTHARRCRGRHDHHSSFGRPGINQAKTYSLWSTHMSSTTIFPGVLPTRAWESVIWLLLCSASARSFSTSRLNLTPTYYERRMATRLELFPLLIIIIPSENKYKNTTSYIRSKRATTGSSRAVHRRSPQHNLSLCLVDSEWCAA